jgi:hypothetical protein
MSISPETNYHHSRFVDILFYSFCFILALGVVKHAEAEGSSAPPVISYRTQTSGNRTLIFSNNPEYLWSSRTLCDLADEPRRASGPECRSTLFQIDALQTGKYRAWWEHRNMMPFIIQSAIIFENNGTENALIDLSGPHVETNSKKNGGREFVALLNLSSNDSKQIELKPGERVVVQDNKNKRIFPGHYFAGVSDFSIISGSVSFSEVVFKKNIAAQLRTQKYENRNNFGVRESLVYKGVSSVSSVELTGANFTVNDETPAGALPISYRPANVIDDQGYCFPDQSPACSGSAIEKSSELSEFSSWVTHIAPDPADPNPKRANAIIDDLVTLVLPASTKNCPSVWPLPQTTAENQCVVMSAKLRWFLPDTQNWRLPNWGNWAVEYRHPISVTNDGTKERRIRLIVTADGESPIAFRGTGVSDVWRQFFLTNRLSNPAYERIVLAQAVVAPNTTKTLKADFILAGPAAGTLQHHVEISE